MVVLLTGASGFVGAHALRALAEGGQRVRALARPERAQIQLPEGVERVEGCLLDEASLRRAMRGCAEVVHAAGLRSEEPRDSALRWRTNVDGLAALLRAAQATRVERFVHVSCAATLGVTPDAEPLDERAGRRGPAPRRNDLRATLVEAEERALAAAWAGMPVSVAIPCAALGPTADGGAARGLAALVGDAGLPARGGTSVADVGDLARGVVLVLERGAAGERYLLGGHNRTWSELAQVIAARDGGAPAAPRRPGLGARLLRRRAPGLEPRDAYRYLDSTKATRELGYALRPLEDTASRLAAARG